MLGKISEKLRNTLKKFFLINDTPHKVAAGAALGIFLGIVPGEGLICTLIVASLLGFNRLAATAGVLAVNMWTTVFVLPLAAGAGALIFQKNSTDLISQFSGVSDNFFHIFFSEIFFFQITLPILVGFAVVSAVIALAVYFGLFALLTNHHRKKERHLFKKKLGEHKDTSPLQDFLKTQKKDISQRFK